MGEMTKNSYFCITKAAIMNLSEAIKARHSVRSYDDRALTIAQIRELQTEINRCNDNTGMHIQLVVNDPKAFGSKLAHYGRFQNVRNYFVIAGKKSRYLKMKAGYYGERLVLKAQTMGLNTCWVALTYSKTPEVMSIAADEHLVCVIALGYGINPGVSHKVKPREKVMRASGEVPEWFLRGVDAALLAPTALNQQRFTLTLKKGNRVKASAGFGPWTKIDLGIVRYHFEIGAGIDNFTWE